MKLILYFEAKVKLNKIIIMERGLNTILWNNYLKQPNYFD